MTSLYFITLHNKIFQTRFRSKTCIVGIPDRHKAVFMRNKMKTPFLQISEVDYQQDEFYEMLKLNQFSLLLVDDVKYNDHNEDFDLRGDVIDGPVVTNDELVQHFEKLYVRDCPQ